MTAHQCESSAILYLTKTRERSEHRLFGESEANGENFWLTTWLSMIRGLCLARSRGTFAEDREGEGVLSFCERCAGQAESEHQLVNDKPKEHESKAD